MYLPCLQRIDQEEMKKWKKLEKEKGKGSKEQQKEGRKKRNMGKKSHEKKGKKETKEGRRDGFLRSKIKE